MLMVEVGDTLELRLGCCWLEFVALAFVFRYLAKGATSKGPVLSSSSDEVKPACISVFGEAVGGSLSAVRSTVFLNVLVFSV